jgi:glycosyltransferase involved in cell wall biosynthesis
MLEWLQVRAARYLDAAIAVSSTIVERLAHAGVPRERIHHVPNGWAGRKDRLGRDHARAELGVPPDTACIGWMGRLTAIKGPDVFVRSLARLTTREWTACIIGDGPDRARLENLADSVGIGDKVRFTGFVQDAGRFVGAFDTFVLSSHSEGTPMALLEAMDAGLPVVATEVGGVPHVVRIPTDGWLVPPDAPDALARAIDECLADRDEASRRGRAGQQRVRAVFEPDRWLERHERIYREAIGVRAARSG